MISDLQQIEAPCAGESPVVVQLPSHLPVQRIYLHRVWKGDECWILLSSGSGAVLGVLASRHSDRLSVFLDRVRFASATTRCAYTEKLFDVGYAMVTYSAAQWLTRELRAVLDMAPTVRLLLSGKPILKGGGV